MITLTLLGWLTLVSLAFAFLFAAGLLQIAAVGLTGRGIGWPFYLLLGPGLALSYVAWYYFPFKLYLDLGVVP